MQAKEDVAIPEVVSTRPKPFRLDKGQKVILRSSADDAAMFKVITFRPNGKLTLRYLGRIIQNVGNQIPNKSRIPQSEADKKT